MTVTESINNAIARGDIKGLRIMMKNSLLVDPAFNEFTEMENLTQIVTGLYDEHDGRKLEKDKSLWDDNYMDKLMVQVVGNFSHERIDHLKEVVRYLRPVTEQKSSSSKTSPRQTSSIPVLLPRSTGYQEQRRHDEYSGKFMSSRSAKIALGAAAGGVLGGVIVGYAGGIVLLGVVAGAVVVGSTITVVTSKE